MLRKVEKGLYTCFCRICDIFTEPNTMEKDNAEIPYHQIFLSSLKLLKSSKFTGNFLIETECADDRPVITGHK